MPRIALHSDQAPAAIGPYSQAVRAGQTVYFSGQIPLDPASGELVAGDIAAQTHRIFKNLAAVADHRLVCCSRRTATPVPRNRAPTLPVSGCPRGGTSS